MPIEKEFKTTMEKPEHFALLSLFNDIAMTLTEASILPRAPSKRVTWNKFHEVRQKYLDQYAALYGKDYYEDVLENLKQEGKILNGRSN